MAAVLEDPKIVSLGHAPEADGAVQLTVPVEAGAHRAPLRQGADQVPRFGAPPALRRLPRPPALLLHPVLLDEDLVRAALRRDGGDHARHGEARKALLAIHAPHTVTATAASQKQQAPDRSLFTREGTHAWMRRSIRLGP